MRCSELRKARVGRLAFAGTTSALLTLAPIVAVSSACQTAPSPTGAARELVIVDSPVVALTGVNLIDGTGAPARSGQTVVIRDGRIEAVGPSGSTAIPEGAEVLELEGHTVIPGLIGLHDHLFYTAAGGRRVQLNFSGPRLYLGSGVTTIRTTGSFTPFADINLKAGIDAGRSPGPRIHITAPYITGDEGPGYKAQMYTPEQARRFVRYWAEEGATWLKAYTTVRRAELAAAIDEAHSQGLKVTGHLCSISFTEAVELGIDNLEHGLLTASDFIPGKQPDECPRNLMVEVGNRFEIDSPETRDVIRTLVDNGVSMTSTMAVYEPFFPGRPVRDERTLELMAPEIREAYLAERDRIDGATENFPLKPAFLEKAMAFEKAFADAGGVLAAGVDPTGIGGALPGLGDQRNVELLIEAGFSAEEAIEIASANGARVLGVFNDLGTVEAGKIADLAVLDGDLARDAAAIRQVTIVFKDGFGYDARALVGSVTGMVGIR